MTRPGRGAGRKAARRVNRSYPGKIRHIVAQQTQIMGEMLLCERKHGRTGLSAGPVHHREQGHGARGNSTSANPRCTRICPSGSPPLTAPCTSRPSRCWRRTRPSGTSGAGWPPGENTKESDRPGGGKQCLFPAAGSCIIRSAEHAANATEDTAERRTAQ